MSIDDLTMAMALAMAMAIALAMALESHCSNSVETHFPRPGVPGREVP